MHEEVGCWHRHIATTGGAAHRAAHCRETAKTFQKGQISYSIEVFCNVFFGGTAKEVQIGYKVICNHRSLLPGNI